MLYIKLLLVGICRREAKSASFILAMPQPNYSKKKKSFKAKNKIKRRRSATQVHRKSNYCFQSKQRPLRGIQVA